MQARNQRKPRYPRRLLVLAAVAALVVVAVPPAGQAADEMTKLQSQLQELQRQKTQATNELYRVNVEAQEAQAQLNLVAQELAEANGQLTAVQTELAVTNNEMKKVKAELAEAQKVYDQRKDLLAVRIRAIREEGRVDYLGVLLGANSFGDFIARFDLLKLVVRRDARLFDLIKADRLALEEQQKVVQEKQTQLLTLQAREQERQTVAAAKVAEREVVSRSLSTRKSILRDQLEQYDRETEDINRKVWELQLAQRRAGGAFVPVYPVRSVSITDSFGPRIHPILGTWRNHNGTDFAVNMGTPIYAIESGVVIVAGWNDAYGYLVVIDHGGGIASWYGHSSRLHVSVGQSVKQGQHISDAGSTGWSTGPHLHLEVHVQGKPVDPMQYLK